MRTDDVINTAMQNRFAVTRVAAAAVLSLHLVVGAAAAKADEEPAEPNARFRVLAEETLSPTAMLRASEVVMAPDETVPSHRHGGSLFVYVIEGDVRSQINDDPVVLYHAGDSWFEPEGVVHTLAENVSDTEPVRLILVLVGPPGAPPSVRED